MRTNRCMNLLVNENVTGTVIDELRQRGHDVLSVKESMRSEDDAVILARAQAEQRIVVTHDKDFVELAFRAQLPATSGIILFRLSGSDPDADNQRMPRDPPGHCSLLMISHQMGGRRRALFSG